MVGDGKHDDRQPRRLRIGAAKPDPSRNGSEPTGVLRVSTHFRDDPMTNDRDRPTLPSDLDRDAREALARLEDRDADDLRAIAAYLEELAAWTESAVDDSDERAETNPAASDRSGDAGDEIGDDHEYPEGVPDRATVTVKEIAGTTYYYYQWRDGDRIESKTVQRE